MDIFYVCEIYLWEYVVIVKEKYIYALRMNTAAAENLISAEQI